MSPSTPRASNHIESYSVPEYDNDSEDPSKPQRSAQESAIFLPFRNRPIRPLAPERKSTDYLGVNLPSEAGSIAPRESLAWDRKSRASVDALRNPFGRDSTYDGLGMEDEEEDDENEHQDSSQSETEEEAIEGD